MARTCDLLGTGVSTGNNVSHSKRRTRTTWYPNLQKKRLFIPELKKSLSLTLSTKALRLIDKRGGLAQTLLQMPEATLSAPLKKARKALQTK